MPNPKKKLPRLGWREWVALPELGIDRIKAKNDTGARSSSLHAFDIEFFDSDGVAMVRFAVHPRQRNESETVTAECPLLESRSVKSSSGHVTTRPVIVTNVQVGDHVWPIELTLATRDRMGFRLLLGRQALRRRFLIHPGKSYLMGKRPKDQQTKRNAE